MIRLKDLVGDVTGYDGEATVTEDDACVLLDDLKVRGEVFVEPSGLVEPTHVRLDPALVYAV